LYVDGRRVSDGKTTSLLTKDPAQGLEIGADAGGAVGSYDSPNGFSGIIDEVRLHFSTFTDEQIAKRFKDGSELADDAALAITFDDGSARDLSTNRNNGTLEGGKLVEGKSGQAILFTSANGAGGAKRQANKQNADQPNTNQPNAAQTAQNKEANQGNSLIKPKWTNDVPIYVRGMVLAGFRLFIVGPPDTIDEEATFQQLTEKDPQVQALLAQQDDALEGKEGGLLLAINAETGEEAQRIKIDSLPTWDGLAGANGKLFLSTLDGQVICFDK